MIFPLTQLCRPILFIQADQKILVKTHMLIHKMLFNFFDNAKIRNTYPVIMHRLSNLAKNQVKAFQGIPELLFGYHVPVGYSQLFAYMIQFFE